MRAPGLAGEPQPAAVGQRNTVTAGTVGELLSIGSSGVEPTLGSGHRNAGGSSAAASPAGGERLARRVEMQPQQV